MSLSPKDIMEEAEDLVIDLSSSDRSQEAIATAVAQFLDGILPLDLLVPSPLGSLIEKNDDVVLKAIVSQLLQVFHADPANKAERIKRRKQRRAERKARQAQKKADLYGN